ncbi:MAG: transpeptidase family protein [Acidobacteria bacterium]|nr:transpeptidase family protein [Acidobacteriota bacterium]
MKQKLHDIVLRRRALILAVFVGFWMVSVGARLVYLQVLRHETMVDLAERQQQRTIRISPLRGTIFDRLGHELARSVEVESVFAVPAEMDDFSRAAAMLGQALNIKPEPLRDRLEDKKEFVWVKRKIPAEEAERVKQLRLPGVHFVTENKRYYPNGDLAAHVLGYTGLDEVGLDGVELSYDHHIRGEEAFAMVLKDARGRSYDRSQTPAFKGQDVTLSIDAAIQLATERELTTAVHETQAASGCAIVMDPNTGEILALANVPTFDPNTFSSFPENRRRNRAIRDTYEPGSVFKIITYGAALQENLARPDENIDCFRGAITLAGHTIRDHKPYGLLSVREALEHSSNVGAIRLGLRVGTERLAKYAGQFGIGRRSGVDLPGETRGLFRSADAWTPVSIGSISMGQEVGVNALQMLAAMSVVANDGVWVQPHVVKTIYSRAGEVLSQTEPERRTVLTRRAARMLADMLEGVVLRGTGKRAGLRGYTAAGKTGTAQQIDPQTRRYSKTRYVASFAGFAPLQNPQLAAIVILDGPKGDHMGGTVAAPVFKRIMETALHYLSVSPDSDDAGVSTIAFNGEFASEDTSGLEDNTMMAGGNLEETPAPVEVVAAEQSNRVIAKALMPDFSGRGIRSVAQDCTRLGLRLVASGSGKAIRQDPRPGTPVGAGTICKVDFGQ